MVSRQVSLYRKRAAGESGKSEKSLNWADDGRLDAGQLRWVALHLDHS